MAPRLLPRIDKTVDPAKWMFVQLVWFALWLILLALALYGVLWLVTQI